MRCQDNGKVEVAIKGNFYMQIEIKQICQVVLEVNISICQVVLEVDDILRNFQTSLLLLRSLGVMCREGTFN